MTSAFFLYIKMQLDYTKHHKEEALFSCSLRDHDNKTTVIQNFYTKETKLVPENIYIYVMDKTWCNNDHLHVYKISDKTIVAKNV